MADNSNASSVPMMVFLVIYGFSPTDISDSIGELKKQTKNLGTHKERQAYWTAYEAIQSGINKYSNIDIDDGKLYGMVKYYRNYGTAAGSDTTDGSAAGKKGRLDFEPFTKRQKALVGTPKLMMGRHIKLLLKDDEGDDDGGGGKNSGKEFIMPWFGDEAEIAYLDLTQGEECISIDSDRGLFISTHIKRKNCAGPSSLKSIDALVEYLKTLQPDQPLQSIAWGGHQPPKVNTYNVILTGSWPSSITKQLPNEVAGYLNTSSMDEIYELFQARRNNQYLTEAETLIDNMITEQNKNKDNTNNASIFTGSMKDLAIARRNAILKKVYISSKKQKFIQLARLEGSGCGFEMIVVHERGDSGGNGSGDSPGKFEEWNGIVFETYYKLDLSIYG